ncbi:MAG: hypothetical protein ACJA15_001595 [Flavobacteriales bacterium]|jgi:hypothetical protein
MPVDDSFHYPNPLIVDSEGIGVFQATFTFVNPTCNNLMGSIIFDVTTFTPSHAYKGWPALAGPFEIQYV